MILGNSLDKIYWKGMLVFGGNGVGDDNVEIPPYEIVEPTNPPTTEEPINPPTTEEPINPPTTEEPTDMTVKVKVIINDSGNATYSLKESTPTILMLDNNFNSHVATKLDNPIVDNEIYFDIKPIYDALESDVTYITFGCDFDWSYSSYVDSKTYSLSARINVSDLFDDNGLKGNVITITENHRTYDGGDGFFHDSSSSQNYVISGETITLPTDKPTNPPTTDEPIEEKSLYTNQKLNVSVENLFSSYSGSIKMEIKRYNSSEGFVTLGEVTSNKINNNSTGQFETEAINFDFNDDSQIYLYFKFIINGNEQEIYDYNDTVETAFYVKDILSNLGDNKMYYLNITVVNKSVNGRIKCCINKIEHTMSENIEEPTNPPTTEEPINPPTTEETEEPTEKPTNPSTTEEPTDAPISYYNNFIDASMYDNDSLANNYSLYIEVQRNADTTLRFELDSQLGTPNRDSYSFKIAENTSFKVVATIYKNGSSTGKSANKWFDASFNKTITISGFYDKLRTYGDDESYVTIS